MCSYKVNKHTDFIYKFCLFSKKFWWELKTPNQINKDMIVDFTVFVNKQHCQVFEKYFKTIQSIFLT